MTDEPAETARTAATAMIRLEAVVTPLVPLMQELIQARRAAEQRREAAWTAASAVLMAVEGVCKARPVGIATAAFLTLGSLWFAAQLGVPVDTLVETINRVIATWLGIEPPTGG